MLHGIRAQGASSAPAGAFPHNEKKSTCTYIDFHDKIINALNLTMRGFFVNGRSRRK